MLNIYKAIKKGRKNVINKFIPFNGMVKPEGYYFAPSLFVAYGWGKLLYSGEPFDIYRFNVRKDITVTYAYDGVPSEKDTVSSCGYTKFKLSKILNDERLRYGVNKEDWGKGFGIINIFRLCEIILKEKDLKFVKEPSLVDYDVGDYNKDLLRLRNKYKTIN